MRTLHQSNVNHAMTTRTCMVINEFLDIFLNDILIYISSCLKGELCIFSRSIEVIQSTLVEFVELYPHQKRIAMLFLVRITLISLKKPKIHKVSFNLLTC